VISPSLVLSTTLFLCKLIYIQPWHLTHSCVIYILSQNMLDLLLWSCTFIILSLQLQVIPLQPFGISVHLCSKGERAFFNVFIFLSVNIDRVHNYLVTTSRISDIIKIWFTSHNRSYWLFTNYQIWNLKKLVKTKSTKENQRKDAFSNQLHL